jgi:hypothetical protein
MVASFCAAWNNYVVHDANLSTYSVVLKSNTQVHHVNMRISWSLYVKDKLEKFLL